VEDIGGKCQRAMITEPEMPILTHIHAKVFPVAKLCIQKNTFHGYFAPVYSVKSKKKKRTPVHAKHNIEKEKDLLRGNEYSNKGVAGNSTHECAVSANKRLLTCLVTP
jgi:hypothetical protein